MTTADQSPFQHVIPISSDNPFPLGRNISHDPRSRGFAVQPKASIEMRDTEWPRFAPILNQQDLVAQGIKLEGDIDALNSCTGNAAIGCVATKPFWRNLAITTRRDLRDPVRAEMQAIDVYAEATELDDFQGTWPPVDNGSSGLGAAKSLQQRGFINSYDHAFGLQATLTALQSGPVMLGINWYAAMFEPDDDGDLEIAGDVVGGHEVMLDGVWITQRVVRMVNSWGPEWGKLGCAFLTFNQLDRLLGEQGDVTVPKL